MATIKEIREEIDKIDTNIIKQLSYRNKLVKKIGDLKLALNQEVIDEAREKKLMQHYEILAEKYDISPTLIKKLFKLIIVNSRFLQNKREP